MKSNFWFYAFLCIFLVLIGGAMNMFVMGNNGCQMPVKTKLNNYQPCYFSIEKTSDAKFGLLGDIFKVTIKNKEYLFSIGDILIFLSGIIFVGLSVVKIYNNFKGEIEI